MKVHRLLLPLTVFLPLAQLAAQVSSSPAKTPAPGILGVRLAMPYAAAHARLAKLGQLKKEDEGQEVWTLLGNEHYQFLIVGFDGERKVRYVTALADATGTPLNYQDVGDTAHATRAGQPGNLTFIWKGEDRKNKFDYLAIAKGKDAQRLSSFTVKRLGVRGEEND